MKLMEQYSFGHWLRLKRKVLDLTREQLAERVGYFAANLRQYQMDMVFDDRVEVEEQLGNYARAALIEAAVEEAVEQGRAKIIEQAIANVLEQNDV